MATITEKITMTKKFILLVFSILMFVGCDWAMENLDVISGTKYIVKSKKKKASDFHYTYRIIKEGDTFYDYHYIDTANYNVGDTLILTIKKIEK